MHGKDMPKEYRLIGGIVTLLVGVLAYLEATGAWTMLGANGLPWLYLWIALMGLVKLVGCTKK